MIEVISIKKDESGLLWLNIADKVSTHEALGVLTMMVKRIERNLIEDEVLKFTEQNSKC